MARVGACRQTGSERRGVPLRERGLGALLWPGLDQTALAELCEELGERPLR